MFEYFYIFVIGFLDIAGLGLIMSSLGVRLRQFGASHFQVNSLESLFSGLQIMTSPIVGTLSDRYGRKQILTLSMLINVICYFLMGYCYTFLSLSVVRLVLGGLSHTIMLGRSLVGDNIPKEHLISVHGKMNGFFSLAMMISPIIGGSLSEKPNGFFYVTCLTSLLCILNLSVIILCVPNKKIKNGNAKKGIFSQLKELNFTVYWPILFMKFTCMALFLTLMISFSMVLSENYKLSPSQIGYTIAFSSSVGVGTGFFSAKLASIFKSYSIFNKCCFSFLLISFGHLGLSFQPNLLYYLIFTIPVGIGGTLSDVFLNQLLYEQSNENNRGSMEGAMASISAISRCITPMVIGITMDKYGAQGVYLLASLTAMSNAVIVQIFNGKRNKKYKKKL